MIFTGGCKRSKTDVEQFILHTKFCVINIHVIWEVLRDTTLYKKTLFLLGIFRDFSNLLLSLKDIVNMAKLFTTIFEWISKITLELKSLQNQSVTDAFLFKTASRQESSSKIHHRVSVGYRV